MLVARQLSMAAYIHQHCRPQARQELARWQQRAAQIPDPHLRRQALESLSTKGFHCEGGAVYAAGAPAQSETLVPAITAFQILVDFLDNLSDRSGSVPEETLRQLHGAVLDALTPKAPVGQYADGRDGGYLGELVAQTQAQLACLPGYPAVSANCRTLGARYVELQVRKHLSDRAARQPALEDWTETLPSRQGWRWWELAAACGSTLGIFALLLAATRKDAPAAGALLEAYFPWVAGLHILLDYFIDQAEDEAGGDFNLIRPYGGEREASQALQAICREARQRVLRLPDPALHTMVVQGLPGLYLSDPKVARQGLGPLARTILRGAGPLALGAYWYCKAAAPMR